MDNLLIRPMTNGYSYLEPLLTEIYGERGSYRYNLTRFVNSEEFRTLCRRPQSIDEIPEISFDSIKREIERRDRDKQLTEEIVLKYGNDGNGFSEEDYFTVAGLMGIAPSPCEWWDTLFPHLVDLWVTSEAEQIEIQRRIEEKKRILFLAVDLMMSSLRVGEILDFEDHLIVSQGYARHYFRGENAYNKTSKASMYRSLPADPAEAELKRIIGDLRMIEFALWLKNIPFVSTWPYGDVFHGAIAQHYGIRTNGMDISCDLRLALFMACCKYESGRYRKLRPEEYENASSRDGVANRGGDSRYGILFSEPADISNMSQTAAIPDLHFTAAIPIGYQPFMRCSVQNGYMIEASPSYDIYQDSSYAKFKFRHSPEICDWIYDQMEEGENVYPQEAFGTCEDVVNTVNALHSFSESAFTALIELRNLSGQADHIKEILLEHGYSIEDHVTICTEQRRAEIEQLYWQNYEAHHHMPDRINMRIRFSTDSSV